jgi:RimJ/RimL family protein N-acetyltransferase
MQDNRFVLRQLGEKDSPAYEALIAEIEGNLVNEKFWYPINDLSREHFFDETWTYLLGLFSGDELLASGGLFFNENEFGESQRILHLESHHLAEIGRIMTRPKYRDRGYIGRVTRGLMEHARELPDIDYVVATAHPDNIPSQKALSALGMHVEASCIKSGSYPRDIFVLKIK